MFFFFSFFLEVWLFFFICSFQQIIFDQLFWTLMAFLKADINILD